MKNLTILFLCGLFVCLSASLCKAQESEIPTNFIVYEEVIAPADIPLYEKVQKTQTELFIKHGFDIPMYCYRTQNNSFYWVVPIKNFSSMDELYKKYNEFFSKLEEDEAFDADALKGKYTQHQSIIHRSGSLSYTPSNIGQTADNAYCEWSFVYLKAQHGKEAAAAIKKYKEFYDSIEESYEWDVYNVVIGQETPCWIFMKRAKSEIAMRQLENDLMEKYGEKFNEMWSEFIPHIRKMETHKGWFVPKWSLNWQ